MAIKLLYGQPIGTRKHTVGGSAAIAVDQPLKLLNNTVVAADPGDTIYCLSKEARTAAEVTAGTSIEVVPVTRHQVYEFTVGTGTMSDDYVDGDVDLKTGATTGLDITASSADDVKLIGWDGVDTAKAYGVFIDTVL